MFVGSENQMNRDNQQERPEHLILQIQLLFRKKLFLFFTKYNFLSSNKKHNFSLFKRAVKIMYKKKHLTKDGLSELLKIREEINKDRGRKRKYSIQDVLESSETIRQATS